MKTLTAFSLALPMAVAAGQLSSPDTGIAASIDRFIRARAAPDSFSGAVLVARNGVPLLRAAYGLADSGRSAPNTVDTKFNLGSVDDEFRRRHESIKTVDDYLSLFANDPLQFEPGTGDSLRAGVRFTLKRKVPGPNGTKVDTVFDSGIKPPIRSLTPILVK